MAAIFPPSDKGGVPPGPNVCNGYTPERSVSGEGPFYVANDCTTVLTDCQLNAITSEILAAVDRLGFTYDSTRITNLADALSGLFNSLSTGKLNISGGTMTGPLILSGDPTLPLGAATKQYVDDAQQDITAALATKVNRAGDTMTGMLTLAGPPTAALHAATRAYVDAGDANTQSQITTRVARAGDTMTGMLTLAGPPTAPLHAVTLQYLQNALAVAGNFPDAPNDGFAYGRRSLTWEKIVRLGGSTMTGLLTLSGDPVGGLHAATKQYVDAQVTANIGAKVNRAGDTMTGFLTLAGPPTTALHAATMGYVDAQVTANLGDKVNRVGDTMTGTLNFNIAAAAGGWNVNNGLAFVRGDGTGQFRSPFDVMGTAAAPNPRVRYLNTAGQITSEIWNNLTNSTINFRTGGNDHVMFSGSGIFLGNPPDVSNCGMFIETGGVSADVYIRANSQYYFRYNTGNMYWMTPLGIGWSCDINRNGTFGRDLVIGNQAFKPGGGPWTDVSDARIKERVRDYTGGLDAICALRPVSFHYLPETGRDIEREHIGLIAQEAEAAMPETVTQAARAVGDLRFDDMRELDTGPVVFALINAVKELAATNDELRARLDALERKGKR